MFNRATLNNLIKSTGFQIERTTPGYAAKTLRQASNHPHMKRLERFSQVSDLYGITSDIALSVFLHRHNITQVIDAGANRGQFGQKLRAIGYSGFIHSFEPMKDPFCDLIHKSINDERWKCYNTGLGESFGEAEIIVYAGETFSSLHAANNKGSKIFGDLLNTKTKEKITLTPLDDVLSNFVDFESANILIKSDCQGHDYEVLKGARTTLRHTKVVLCETSQVPIYEGARSEGEIDKLLSLNQFEVAFRCPISINEYTGVCIESDSFYVKLQ